MAFEDEGWPDKYIGVPFRSRGRDWDGWDCWGLVCSVYLLEHFISLPSYADGEYRDALESHDEILAVFNRESEEWREVDGQPRSGDIAWCSVAGRECHVGIVVRPGRLLHAIEGHDTSIIRYGSSVCPIRVKSFYRHALLAR